MDQYCIVSRESQNVISVIFENNLSSYPDTEYYKILMTREQLGRTCSVDVLSFRMNENIPEVFIDSNKYSSCKGMDDIREKRNRLLSLTDWMVLPDSPISEYEKTEILEYRRQLRELPNGDRHPYDIVIPRHSMIKFPWET